MGKGDQSDAWTEVAGHPRKLEEAGWILVLLPPPERGRACCRRAGVRSSGAGSCRNQAQGLSRVMHLRGGGGGDP